MYTTCGMFSRVSIWFYFLRSPRSNKVISQVEKRLIASPCKELCWSQAFVGACTSMADNPHAPPSDEVRVRRYRGTSLIRKRTPLGPYRRPMPRGTWGGPGGWAFSHERGTPVKCIYDGSKPTWPPCIPFPHTGRRNPLVPKVDSGSTFASRRPHSQLS